MSTSCAPSNRKRPFDALDGNGKNDTAIAAADKVEPPLSIEALLKVMEQKFACMQTKLDETVRENEERMDDIDKIRDENIELKTKYHKLEIKVKDLTLKNEYNEWSYTAEDIPSSYWIERGFAEEEYAERMIEFLRKMKEYTHQLRRGEPPKEIELAFTNDHMLHDDIMLPHWKEFADALKQYQKFDHRKDYGIQGFRIGNLQLQQEVLDMLTPALQTLDIKYLGLGGNIGSDVLPFAEGILHHNPYIHGICWNNQIESVDDIRRLCKSIKESVSNSFTSLALINCFDGNNLQMMQTILDASRHLEILGLSHNEIGTAGAPLIANFLAANPPLEDLRLGNTDLNDDDATLLANALKNNTHLQRIYLEDNNDITLVGRRVLLESVFDVSSLNACAASNHSCCIHGLHPDIPRINNYDQPSANRAMKVFTMLSATDEGFFNMNCLGDVSYKLIPDVLRLAQKFKGRTPELSDMYFEQTGQTSADWSRLNEDTVPITSMFKLLRGWAVPSLSD